MTISERFAQFITGTTYDSLPTAIVDETKLRVLDTIGALAAGSTTPVAKMMSRSAIPSRNEQAWTSAVLVNCAIAHCAEIDDIHPFGVVCTGAMVVPASLAAATEMKCDGKELIAAIAVGYEVATRCALAISGAKLLAKGWWPSATIGPLGVAAAVSKLINSEQTITQHALGIAGILAGGLITGDIEGVTGKHFLFGRAAQNGAEASLLAAEGFRGPLAIFEDDRGLFASRGVDSCQDDMVEGLGSRYLFPATAFKANACALQLQAAVIALLDLMKAHKVTSENVRSIKVKLPSRALVIVNAGMPMNHHSAAASARFVIALALLDGEVSLEQFNEKRMADERVRRLMGMVEAEADDRLDPDGWPALVEVETVDGGFYRREMKDWVPQEISEKKTFVENKFRRLTGRTWDSSSVEHVIRIIDELEEWGAQGIPEGLGSQSFRLSNKMARR